MAQTAWITAGLSSLTIKKFHFDIDVDYNKFYNVIG